MTGGGTPPGDRHEKEAIGPPGVPIAAYARPGPSVTPLSELTPQELGVRQSVVDSTFYVVRDLDAVLRKHLEEALKSDVPAIVAVTGPPLAGKSRTAYEAVMAEPALSGAEVIAPRNVEELARLLDPRVVPESPVPLVIWLDDLETIEGSDLGTSRSDLPPSQAGSLSAHKPRLDAVLPLIKLPRRFVAVATWTSLEDSIPGGYARLRDSSSRVFSSLVRLERSLTKPERERFLSAYPP